MNDFYIEAIGNDGYKNEIVDYTDWVNFEGSDDDFLASAKNKFADFFIGGDYDAEILLPKDDYYDEFCKSVRKAFPDAKYV